MSVRAQAWAWEQDVPASTKAVLLALADHADNEGICWPGVKSVAEKCRLTKNAVRYHLRILRKKGLLISQARQRDDGSQTSNAYHLPVNILIPPSQTIDTPLSRDLYPPYQTIDTHEPSIEPSVNHSIYIYKGDEEKNNSHYPEWLTILLGLKKIKGVEDDDTPSRIKALLAWVERKDLSEERCEDVAVSLAAKWPWKKNTDRLRTFQDWIKGPKQTATGEEESIPRYWKDNEEDTIPHYWKDNDNDV